VLQAVKRAPLHEEVFNNIFLLLDTILLAVMLIARVIIPQFPAPAGELVSYTEPLLTANYGPSAFKRITSFTTHRREVLSVPGA
jgi:hypothetical protein